MLHELLLALSGHPSPILSVPINKPPFQDLLSPAEAALLQSLARNLGEKHKNIRKYSSTIANGHPSMVCRALAAAIISTHLAAFQQKILEVERDILEKNSDLTEIRNIVPLSGLVGAFDGWSRRLEWLWNLVQFMLPFATKGRRHTELDQEVCAASRVLDHLRKSTHTGYPDIEQISLSLTTVAEAAWLKQMSAWVLYGRLPSFEDSDFFVIRGKSSGDDEIATSYSINFGFVPPFVTESTAKSILFIGKSLNHIRENNSTTGNGSAAQTSPLELLPSHLAHLSSLEFPINPSSFSAAISAIRLSLSKNALQKLLPISKVLAVLRVLKNFFLLERGEFAVALISAAEERLASRHNRSIDKLKRKGSDGLADVILKDGEVAAVLAKTWTALLSQQGADDDEDADDLDLARELLQLSIKPQSLDASATGEKASSKFFETQFNDFLLSTPTTLQLRIPSPLDLLLSSSSVNIYSQINAYLIAIRKGHLCLSQLFLSSPLRRDHPSPKGPDPTHEGRFETLSRMRQRANRRTKTMRPIWATIGSATFLLTELGEYFQGQVIASSWTTFQTWLDPSSYRPSSSSSSSSTPSTTPSPPLPSHDPETLSQAHKTYLSSLTHALLLTHPPFTRALRAFLLSTTHLVALTHRLATVQQALDLESDTLVIVDALADFHAEHDRLLAQLHDARRGVDTGMTDIVSVLRKVDSERAGGGGGGRDEAKSATTDGDDKGGFVPWGSGVGVERLLLKIDWANGSQVGV